MSDVSLLNRTEEIILASVLKLGPKGQAFGVTIYQTAQGVSAGRVPLGSVYTTLDRLEQKGFVESWYSNGGSERGNRAKRCYRITAEGRRAIIDSQRLSQGIATLVSVPWGAA
jgi:DNA-binding PadR family transcriptional regulator